MAINEVAHSSHIIPHTYTHLDRVVAWVVINEVAPAVGQVWWAHILLCVVVWCEGGVAGVIQVHPAGGSGVQFNLMFWINYVYNEYIAYATLHAWCECG